MEERKRWSIDRIEHDLSEQERRIIGVVGKLRLVTSAHVRRLYFPGDDFLYRRRRANATLRKLVDRGFLIRLERRLGGAIAGSDAFAYRLGALGHRLVRFWNEGVDHRARNLPEPGTHFVRHRLAATEFYVALIEAERTYGKDVVEVLEFLAEPDSWRDYVGTGGVRMKLKPDTFVRLGLGDIERHWFVELDLGTVGSRARESQAESYRQYFWCGAAGEVMPGVLWVARNDVFAERAKQAIRPHREPRGMFTITTREDAVRAAMAAAQGVSHE